MTVAERFWAKVNENGPVHPGLGTACWVWTGRTMRGGYGDFRPDGETHVVAHRWAWEQRHGQIPAGLLVLHRCDNPPCVNDAHHFLGTQQDNMDDMAAKGRKRVFRGEEAGRAKLSNDDVQEIRRLVNVEHMSRTMVADRYGLHHKTVVMIASGGLWSHLPMLAPAWDGRAKPGRKPGPPHDPTLPIRCGRCRETKPPLEFAPSMRASGSGTCRPCMRAAYGGPAALRATKRAQRCGDAP